MRAFLNALKVISVITLAFFSWAYLPLYQIAAFAATKEKQSPKAQGRTAPQGPAEKFEKLIDDIREKTGRAEAKATKGEDATSEIESVKSRKTELDDLDSDLKKDFAATEQKLRAANLPKEILDRHSKFVKNYEDNLAELKANIDAVEKAKTPSVVTKELAKTKKHLDKVKPAKKRKPFDPNKLPNRIVKAKERQPKLKKEEWEKELKKESVKEPRKIKDAQRQQHTPILVASNGSLAGLLATSDSPFFLTQPEDYPQLALSTDGLIQTAQTGSYGKHPFPPEIYPLPWVTDMVPEDKQETPETHVTDAIRAKAAELQNNPVLMFNWLRNNIYLVPSYGSIQGADMCLQTKQCNFTDIASLTVAMFRAADWPARYEFLTAELDIERFMENMGGFTDPQAAITFAATGGIPVRPVISGGKITSVQFEHVYATALLPMGYYIGVGSLMRRGWSEPMWMPLDVSLKHYVTTPGLDISAAVPFDVQAFANQIQSTATINETDGSVTNVNSALIQQTMQDYQTRVQDYISQNTPTATVGDVIGKREIKQHDLPHLYPTGWFKPVTARVRSHTLPDSMKSSISFNIPDPSGVNNGLSYTTTLAGIAGKKITLSFSPATAADQAVIDFYLPKPHADGTPIQPSELPASFLAYLINLRPELRVGGQVVASGSAVTMGAELSFTIAMNEPGIGPSHIDNIVKAGEYYGIGLDAGGMGDLTALKAKLEETKAKIDAQNSTDITKDDIVGDLLYTTIAVYFAELDAIDEITARTMNVIRYRASSVGMFSLALNIKETFGVPTSAGPKGMIIDVDRLMQGVLSKDGNIDKVKQYMLASGSNSSALEHAVPEKLFSIPSNQVQGISAVKTLMAANDQSIPIYVINQSNINAILPQLQLNGDVKSDIQNAVNAGKIVTVQKTDVTYNGWTGCGYIIIDPNTGAGAYMISGGANGGGFMYVFWSVMWVLAWVALITSLTVLAAVAVAFLPEIIAALGSVYLTASITTAIFIESKPFLNSLFTTINLWAQYSPPPVPAPTTEMQGLLFFIETRILFYYYSFKKYLDASIMYWRFAMNVPFLTRR